ncbi:hypothetical protein HHL16_09790 [Pseudoflavitalea sp. G-6-1-2]|uniref:hypothetical protein n=1 Tax=Pseudoflavitalea sp. G-6-1-2 TaxID=2728841 RepID=UPI00146C8C56|nr:hypothetical protein [Pseudoflavitalea sp. G-6-1-2]NML21166.1 hypothetical protein [Pseudoflavitalea sp. G-6-1-2]
MITKNNTIGFLIFLLTLTMVSCKKETLRQSDNIDAYKLTVKDNPSDPVDHAIYQFYQETGIPLYYNDTIAREKVGDSAGIPRYLYHKLAIGYSPLGTQVTSSRVLLPDKDVVISMLPFLKEKLLPQLPRGYFLQSLFVVKSASQRASQGLGRRVNHPFLGFNTLMLIHIDPAELSDSSQRKYIADALGVIAFKMLETDSLKRLGAEFNSITQSTTSSPGVYLQELAKLTPEGDGKLEDFSFLPIRFMEKLGHGDERYSPTWQVDFLAYLEAVFFYNNHPTANFETDFAAYPLIIKKFKVIQKILKDVGFNISG